MIIELMIRGERIALLTINPLPLSDEITVGMAKMVHEGCSGFVDRRPVSSPWTVLCCRFCNLRVLLPQGVKTYGDLEQWAEGHIS